MNTQKQKQKPKNYSELYKERKAEKERLSNLFNSRNIGIKFPFKCSKCGALTQLIKNGAWKGTYHYPECDIYQEYLHSEIFSNRCTIYHGSYEV